ncbi:GNAT family N-acetyltransferase [Amycolatopsis pithecellobii]|uniref:GNAT family N-acetyltransferase n=1 Tax=Amycolatopsis pithecellobii TaxID=664692 RepID=A0A6N7Z675_9PSEU|nr:GNAT family N-acetyltransferase [Amycolatopsis pithecellobii]MTD56200.1 GNAT family N-acetyltransferase [Amycolatopsis pithecellobii]
MPIVITPAAPGAVERLLTTCSANSLRQRFFLGGEPDPRDIWCRYRKFLLTGEALVAWAGDHPAGLLNVAAAAPGVAELGLLVADPWQRQGVGTRLAETVWCSGHWAGHTVYATARAGNDAALAFLARQGFRHISSADGSREFELRLPGAASMTRVMEEVAG